MSSNHFPNLSRGEPRATHANASSNISRLCLSPRNALCRFAPSVDGHASVTRVRLNDHRLAPHRTNLMYLEAMQRTFTSAQIQLSSETWAILRRLNKLEEEMHQFAVEVSEFVKRTQDDRFSNLKLLSD